MLCALLAFVAGCAPGFEAFRTIDNTPADWRMFRNSPCGYYQKGVFGGKLTRLLWKGEMKARSYSTPVATGSYVAISGLDGYMYFFEPGSGELINAYKFRVPMSHSPLVSDRVIYVAAADKKDYLAGLNLITGKLVFKEKLEDIQAPIIGDENSIYCSTFGGKFICLNKFTGGVKWEFKAGDAILNAPAVCAERIYVGSLDHYLYALNPDDGKLLWKFDCEGAIAVAPAADSMVFFADLNGNVYAVRGSDGQSLWQFKTGGQVLSSPVIDDERVYIGSNDRYLYCLEKQLGMLLWKFEADAIINATPLVLEDVVVIVSAAGTISWLDRNTGQIQAEYKINQMVKSSPVYFNQKIYLPALDKKLYCFGQ